MLNHAALTLLSTLASLQRRHSGAILLLSSNRSRVWPDSAPEAAVAGNRALLRELEAERLVMAEPYAETKPRGTQILGMTSQGWRLAEQVNVPSAAPQRAA